MADEETATVDAAAVPDAAKEELTIVQPKNLSEADIKAYCRALNMKWLGVDIPTLTVYMRDVNSQYAIFKVPTEIIWRSLPLLGAMR